MTDDELRKQLPQAEGPAGLIAMLAEMQNAKNNQCVLYRNGGLEALLWADFSKQPCKLLYSDLRKRPAPQALLEALARFVWDNAGGKAGDTQKTGYETWRDTTFATEHFTDVSREDVRLRNPVFGLFIPAQVNPTLSDAYESLKQRQEHQPAPVFRP